MVNNEEYWVAYFLKGGLYSIAPAPLFCLYDSIA